MDFEVGLIATPQAMLRLVVCTVTTPCGPGELWTAHDGKGVAIAVPEQTSTPPKLTVIALVSTAARRSVRLRRDIDTLMTRAGPRRRQVLIMRRRCLLGSESRPSVRDREVPAHFRLIAAGNSFTEDLF